MGRWSHELMGLCTEVLRLLKVLRLLNASVLQWYLYHDPQRSRSLLRILCFPDFPEWCAGYSGKSGKSKMQQIRRGAQPQGVQIGSSSTKPKSKFSNPSSWGGIYASPLSPPRHRVASLLARVPR